MVEESPAARRADGFCGDAAIYPKGTAKARSPGAAGAPLKRREVASNPRPLRSVTRSPTRGAGSGVLPATNIAQGKRPPSAPASAGSGMAPLCPSSGPHQGSLGIGIEMMTSETAQAARRPAGAIRSGDLVLSAARIEAEAASKRGDPLNAVHCKRAAELRERVATAPEYMTEIGVGRELVPASILGENSRALEFADTVQNPNYVTVDASRDRLDLAHRAGTLELGLDAAESIEARNSLEKMLAHQLAAMHASSLKLAESAQSVHCGDVVLDPDVRERANVQGTRLAGAITREHFLSAGLVGVAARPQRRPAGRDRAACPGERGRAGHCRRQDEGGGWG